jgi:hypothetical protein
VEGRSEGLGGESFPPGIFPDQLAPIVRNSVDGKRELVMARWGMPGPLQFGGQPVTNIRNVSSAHWRGWLEARNRCLVPATSFCEYEDTKPRKTPTWFALSEDRRLFAFAGLRTRWRGVRGPKSAPVEGEHELFGFLTTEANAMVAPIHSKAMPVILTTRAGRRARRQMCALDVDGARGSLGEWSRTSHASVEPMNEAIGRPDDGRPRGTSSARDEPISEGWG